MLNELRRAISSDSRRVLRQKNANNRQLRDTIHTDALKAIKQVKPIAERFRGATWHDTGRNIHRFMRRNFLYLRDASNRQRIKMPSAIIRDLFADCKSFSLTPFAILHVLGAPGNRFKYASYPDTRTATLSKIPSHIYNRFEDENGNEIILDATASQYGYEKPPYHSFTVDPMRVETLSDEVLANEVLADETLSTEATKIFIGRLRKMGRAGRRKFIRKFNPANRKKLIRSIRSYQKIKQINPNQGKRSNPIISGVAGISYEADQTLNDQSLAGKKRKAKRAAKKEKKAAKAKPGSNKAKRLATKAKILKAKATGDKAGLKAAKKERKARIKGNVKKVGKVLAKIDPVMALGRGSFLGLVAVNTRGFASNIAEAIKDPKDRATLKKKWEAIGGKFKKLEAAVNKGKNKKALLGKKKINDEVLAGFENGECPLGNPAAAVAAAGTVIGIIIPVVSSILKKKGKPEAAAALDGVSNAITKITSGEAPGSDSILGKIKNMKENVIETVSDFVSDNPGINPDYVQNRIEEDAIVNTSSDEEGENLGRAKADAKEIVEGEKKGGFVLPLVGVGLAAKLLLAA